MENIITGYKAFEEKNGKLTNKYGHIFEIEKIYTKEKSLKYGYQGHGHHFCKNLEDTMRFFNSIKPNNKYCQVTASGKILKTNYVYYDAKPMYVSESIIINKILTREDILEYTLNLNEIDLSRMLSLYCFQKEELELIKEYCNYLKYEKAYHILEEYQTADTNTYKRNPKYLRKY